MKTKYLDTNLILRLIIQDEATQLEYVKSLLLQASQKQFKLFTSTVVIFECEWVLRSFYKLKKNDICLILQKIILIQEIDFENSEILYESLEGMMINNLGLEDNFHLMYAKKHKMELETFDKKLKNFKK